LDYSIYCFYSSAAVLIVYFLATSSGVGATIGSLTNSQPWEAVLLETILTFFLVSGILFISINNMITIISGFAIGLIIVFDTLAGDYLTGASMNPARSFGPALFSNNLSTYWIYLIGHRTFYW
jgi:aquaporin Z